MYASIRLSVMGMVMGKEERTMARMLGRLTAIQVQNLRERGYYGDGGGLYVRVAPGGREGLDISLRGARPAARHGARRISRHRAR
jgi:hypothetical protein